jgi:L-lactate permease
MISYDITEWLWTFAIGVPILTASAWWRWRRSQDSVVSRWVLCLIIAGIVTPFVFQDESTDIFPASVALLGFAITSFREHLQLEDYLIAIWMLMLPILVGSLVILGIWSVILSVWRKRKQNAAWHPAGAK